MRKYSVCLWLLLGVALSVANAQTRSAQPSSGPALPYSPSLDLSSMDKSVDPCVDLYHYSCGGWQKKNPIPPDQTSWSVYGKLYQDNLIFLRGMLEQAAQPNDATQCRDPEDWRFLRRLHGRRRRRKARPVSRFSRNSTPLRTSSQRKISRLLVARLQLTYSGYSYSSSMLFRGWLERRIRTTPST